MLNVKRSLILIFFIFILQILIYSIFFRPFILSWGASKDEAKMILIGDNLVSSYSSTRAITLNAPIVEAWQTIISLGADRGGFYSYAFMENMVGYVGKKHGKSAPDIYKLKVGRIVPGTLDESGSFIKALIKKYNWNWIVLAVDPGKAFVLRGWGAFVLKEVAPNKTRLIVRTHDQESSNFISKINRFVMIALHYIMERRMMMGFQAQFEPDVQPSYVGDILWFCGLILSFLGICSLVFICRGIQSVASPMILGVFWLFVLLVIKPFAQYSLILCVITMVIFGRYLYRNRVIGSKLKL